MNRTIVFVTIATLGVIGGVVVIIFAPDNFAPFVSFVGTLAALAITLTQLDKVNTKVDQVAKNTNGTNNVLLAAALQTDPLTPAQIEQIKSSAPIDPTGVAQDIGRHVGS